MKGNNKFWRKPSFNRLFLSPTLPLALFNWLHSRGERRNRKLLPVSRIFLRLALSRLQAMDPNIYGFSFFGCCFYDFLYAAAASRLIHTGDVLSFSCEEASRHFRLRMACMRVLLIFRSFVVCVCVFLSHCVNSFRCYLLRAEFYAPKLAII